MQNDQTKQQHSSLKNARTSQKTQTSQKAKTSQQAKRFGLG